jgi:hypothetical protein
MLASFPSQCRGWNFIAKAYRENAVRKVKIALKKNEIHMEILFNKLL